jgi:hypothetical protein
MTRTNLITTVGGFLAAMGTLPTLVSNSHLDFPLWWNSVTFPLNLAGLVGLALLGWAAKGADQHSTAPQVEAASLQKQVDVIKDQANESPKPVTEVTIVPPLAEVLHDPQSAEAEILRLRAALNIKSDPSPASPSTTKESDG